MDDFEYTMLDAQIRLFAQIDLLPDGPQNQLIKDLKEKYADADRELRQARKAEKANFLKYLQTTGDIE